MQIILLAYSFPQVIKGQVKCNGCILSANLNGTDLRLIGWGFRNPTGLAFNEEGRLFAAVMVQMREEVGLYLMIGTSSTR